jgi:class 3 adenylate cyclase
MKKIGALRIGSVEELSFGREKLRAVLAVANVHPVAAGQVIGVISESIRKNFPVELGIEIDDAEKVFFLSPDKIVAPYQRIILNEPLNPNSIDIIKQILNNLSREELLNNLEFQVKERTIELSVEREKSEKLLENMLPNSIAMRLKEGESIADRHEASVIFIDIVGFTKWASKLNASELVLYLEKIFGKFDDCARRHGLEKIKTIGDCYMAASGLPTPQIDHADRAVLMQLCEEIGFSINVRVGVHCGPLIAGVIGNTKPFYDIWGDTVNIASRMESHGSSGCIQISEDLKNKLLNSYKTKERGVIDIKNHGKMKTWFVYEVDSEE